MNIKKYVIGILLIVTIEKCTFLLSLFHMLEASAADVMVSLEPRCQNIFASPIYGFEFDLVIPQPSGPGLADASPQRGSSTCFMTRLSSPLNPNVDNTCIQIGPFVGSCQILDTL